VVTADGSLLRATEIENEDLFWALRGGGGNFGVVTSFEYRLHPVGPEVFFCFVLYPLERAKEVLQSCESYLREADDEVAPLGVFGRVPDAEEFPAEAHGAPYVALLALHPGVPSEGESALAPLRELGHPIADMSGLMPYTEAQSVLDEDYPDGWRYYWKSVNVTGIGDAAIERLVECASASPSPHSTIDVWFQGGAMAAVGEHETVFANREQPYLLGIEGNWEDEASSDANVAWVRRTEMGAFSEGGTYLNFPGCLEDGDRMVQEGYGGNYERLVEVKTRYDPNNLFRLNANIQPAS
jgi:FAD/FMN-containing dehydrogenase